MFQESQTFEIGGINFKNIKFGAPSQPQTFKQWAFGCENLNIVGSKMTL